MKKIVGWVSLIIVLMLAVAVYFYVSPLMPVKIATHWNMYGLADGFSSKALGLFLFPGIAVILTAILLFLPALDPKKENIQLFEEAYHRFILVFLLFLFYLFFLTILWNLSWVFSFNQALAAGMAWFIYEIGKLLGQVKMNYTIGIRTPWTLYNEEAWNKTHEIVSRWTTLLTLLLLLGVFFPKYFFLILIVFLILFIGLSFGVSYWVFKKTKTNQPKL